MTLRVTRSLLLLAAAFLLLPGCDTSDPEPPVEPAEAAGIYDFQEFRFVPTSSGIVPLNLLDTLVTDETRLELATNGEFQLVYRLEGSTFADNVRGTFEVSQNEVELNARDVDVARLETLLLRQRVTLERSGVGTLSLDGDRTVDLEAFDEVRYGGLNAVPGTLRLRLVERDDAGT